MIAEKLYTLPFECVIQLYQRKTLRVSDDDELCIVWFE